MLYEENEDKIVEYVEGFANNTNFTNAFQLFFTVNDSEWFEEENEDYSQVFFASNSMRNKDTEPVQEGIADIMTTVYFTGLNNAQFSCSIAHQVEQGM
jgi:hypothetical protein